MTSFDMVDEPWVPVTVAGRRVEVSLREAVTRAHEIDGLAVDDPLQAVAVLRQVLLPVVLDALGAPRSEDEWARRWEAQALDAGQLSAYLDQHADRFDLFHPVQPFGQVAGLRTGNGETKPVSLLIPAMAAGNNVPLFGARTEADPPPLSPAEAARALLTAQCWDTAAIKSGAVGDPQVKQGKTTGNPIGPVGQLGVVVPVGGSLAETLLLNMPILRQGLGAGDRPQWRAEPPTAEWRQRPPAGLVDLLTWQSRRIRLLAEAGGPGRVVVRRVVLAAGDRLPQTPESEPHTAWRQMVRPHAGEPPRRPLRHEPGWAAWRGLAGLLATRQPTEEKVSSSLLLTQVADLRAGEYLPADLRLQVLTVGVEYGNKYAVVEDMVVDLIPLPVVALATEGPVRGLLLDVVGHAEELRDAANRLGDDLRRAAGGDKLPGDKGHRLGDALVHQFTPSVHRLLAGLQRDPDRVDDAERAWRQAARQLAMEAAEPALAAAPPKAFLGCQKLDKPGKPAWRLSTAEARYRAAVTRILGAPGALQPNHLHAEAGV